MPNETLGANFSIDITSLKAGLKQADRMIRESESEFKAAAAGMDDWSTSSDGVTARIKHLTNATDLQQKKVSALKQEYDRLVAEGLDPASSAATELRTKINNEQAALNKNLNELNAQKDALNDVGKASDGAGKGFSALKGIAAGAVAAVAAVGAAAVAAVAGFLALAESTRETRTQMAQLETAFSSVGLSTEQAEQSYVKLTGVLGDTGKATEAAQQIAQLASNEKELADLTNIATGVYATFGESLPTEALMEAINHSSELGSVQGNLADALEWSGVTVDDFNVDLAKCSTEQERQELITKTLNGLYGKQADTYKELNKDVIDAQEAQAELTLAQAELGKAAEPLNTAFTKLKTSLLTGLTPAVTELAEALTDLIKGNAGAAEKIMTQFDSLFSNITKKAVEFIPKLFDILNSILPKTVVLLKNITTEAVKGVGNILPSLTPKLAELLSTIIQTTVSATPDLLSAAMDLLMSIVDSIPPTISKLLSEFPKVLNTLFDAVSKATPILFEKAGQLFQKIIDAIPLLLQSLQQNLPKIINSILGFITTNMPKMLESAKKLLMQVVAAIPSLVSNLGSNLPKVIVSITSSLLSAAPKILSTAIKMFGGLLQSVPKIAGDLLRAMPKIIGDIVIGLLKGVKDLVKVGADLIGGLIKGMLDPKAIWNGIKKIGNSVVKGFKDFFGIHSPSTLMADVVGKNLALGIGEGFENQLRGVNRSMVKSLSAATPIINQTGYAANNPLASRQSGNITVNQYNTYSQAHTPYEIYKSKQQTAAAVRLALGGAL